MYPTFHENALWRYEDARGVVTLGHFAGFHDRGGTDVTYAFRACEDGELSLVSGARLKRATRLWHACGRAGQIA